jgi:hypothetical protein
MQEDTITQPSPATQASQPCILNFKVFPKGGALRGFFDLRLPSGLVLKGCQLLCGNGQWWVGLPSKPFVKTDGTQGWQPMVEFADSKVRKRFHENITPLARAAFEAHGFQAHGNE